MNSAGAALSGNSHTTATGGVSSRSPKNARPGDILLVIHEFQARSEDELGLSKGDRVELIERDDDFGDGWYLGKHVQTERTGLFPEVYTIMDPRQTQLSSPAQPKHLSSPNLAASPHPQSEAPLPTHSPNNDVGSKPPITPPPGSGFGRQQQPMEQQGSSYSLSGRRSQNLSGYGSTASLVSGTQLSEEPESLTSSRVLDDSSATAGGRVVSQSSTVMTETLDVINEHITDMKKPSMGVGGRVGRRGSVDSVSLYSRHMNQSMGHIKGVETDEEEGPAFTKEEVSRWSPAQTAKHLERLGVEKSHCEVFREQEFSGDVLLAMEQSAIFLKELDLGPIGRRLKTWNKIRALQDEVRATQISSPAVMHQNAPPTSSSKAAVLSGSSGLPHIPQLRANQKRNSIGSIVERNQSNQASQHRQRPSAASIREIAHSRRHSSVDNTPVTTTPSSPARPIFHHQKQGSFDQNWSMNAQQSNRTRPTSIVQSTSYDRSVDDMMNGREPLPRDASQAMSDYERGYSSGGDVGRDARHRRLLRKKSPRTDHHRYSSVGSEASISRSALRSSIAPTSTSRSTSVTPSIAKVETGSVTPTTEKGDDVRIVSGTETTTSDGQAPIVTRLEYDNKPGHGSRVSRSKTVVSPVSSPVQDSPSKGYRKGLRTISDAITGRERAQFGSPDQKYEEQDTSLDSPQRRDSPDFRTGSSTPSGTTKSMDEEQPVHPGGWAPLTSSTGSHKKKSKKETSAYTRGLERKTPQEQMVGADYSGWMRKKSSNLMTTWKPRLFILKGRRLSYYYSESDTEEKGLIDISNHRVLPANNDFFTGLHATLTGAGSHPSPNSASPLSPSTASHDTTLVGSIDSPTSPAGSGFNSSPDFSSKEGVKTFIFKLLPPRSGLQKAVNFTKPTVHYFAVPSLQEGRSWMAAIMKATIDRDESVKVITTYTQKTISLEKARARQERPPFLKNVAEEDDSSSVQKDRGSERLDGGEDSGSITAPSSEVGSSRIEITDVEPYELPRSKEERAQMENAASSGGRNSTSGTHKKQESTTTNGSSVKDAGHGLGIQGAISGGLKTVGGLFTVHNKESSR